MSTDSFSTHSLCIQKAALLDCILTVLCATKTMQARNGLNEKNLGTAQDNPSMGKINDITASTQQKTRSDREQLRKFYRTYHKSVAADPALHSTLPR